MKRTNFFLLLSSLLALIVSSAPVFADEKPKLNDTPDALIDLAPEQLDLISSSCSTYRTSLKNLQRSDSRARTYFGAIYESISSKFLTPLNLRLVKNNLSSPSLISAQTSLASLRSAFSSDFIVYSKSLDDLIATDCRLEPESFYIQLLDTRKKRALVAKDMKAINALLSTLPRETETLMKTLSEQDEDQHTLD